LGPPGRLLVGGFEVAIAITEDHRLLAGVARSFAVDNHLQAQARIALEAAPAVVPTSWPALAHLGWIGLHVPESQGGSGFGWPEVAVVAFELGYSISPAPFLTGTVGAALLANGHESQPADRLPAIIEGTVLAGIGLSGQLTGNGWLTGDAGIVLGGLWAQLLFLRVGDDVVVIESDRPGLTIEAVPGLDPSLGMVKVRCESVEVADADRLPHAAAEAVAALRTVCAAEAAGGARACLDMAIDYANSVARSGLSRP
jgi:alkylation response protein AidB-like acyl-CoA dehydrogenase